MQYFDRLLNDNRFSYKLSMWIVLISYSIIYFLFLLKTQFLPYVFDNNETFSSLIHAQNMFHFGFKETFGLTDEAYGFLKSAHPYVYTHQGNFPRFYALLLYLLGVKSAEGQIFITTFTVGLAGIWLAHRYFAQHVSHLFATIYCLLLMTDYIMFAQWQINTWRAWHLFFFFSSFLCCHCLNGKNWKWFIPITIINFACLYYTEIVYASFVFFSASVYLFLVPNVPLKNKIFNFGVLIIGVMLGIGVLIGQNIAYLGWPQFLQDLTYTFTARNQLTDGNKALETIKFYNEHKIVFWDNFNAFQKIRNPLLIIKNFYRYCLLPYGALISAGALLTILSSLIVSLFSDEQKNRLEDNRFSFLKSPYALFVGGVGLISILCLIFFTFHPSWDDRVSHIKLLMTGFTLALFSLLFIWLRYQSNIGKYIYLPKIDNLFLLISFSLALNFCFLIFLLYPSLVNHLVYRFLFIIGIFVFMSYISLRYLGYSVKVDKLLSHYALFNIKSVIIFLSMICFFANLVFMSRSCLPIDEGMTAIFKSHSGILINILLALTFFYLNRNIIYHHAEKLVTPKILVIIFYFLSTLLLSYVLYHLNKFCGRISIELQKQTMTALKIPAMTVFVLGLSLISTYPLLHLHKKYFINNEQSVMKKVFPLFIAAAIGFILTYLLFPGYITTGYWFRYCCFTVFIHLIMYVWLFFTFATRFLYIFRVKTWEIKEHIKAGMNLALLLIFTYLWLNLQYYYIREFPPADFNFVKLLKKSPLHEQSIVSNTYAAPFSYNAQTWAYSDPVFAQSKESANNKMLDAKYDYRYLWFADFKTNSRYKKPLYFVCWQSYYSLDLLKAPKPACADFPLIQFVRNHSDNNLDIREVARDLSGRDKWSIVKLPATL